jgi:hypothetical protein
MAVGQDPCEPKMHFAQYPNPVGWDVRSCFSHERPDYVTQMADDWQCTESGPVSTIVFWGSWLDDRIGSIIAFHVEIYENSYEGGYSHPIGEPLWERIFPYYMVEITDRREGEQGWYDPPPGDWRLSDHRQFFQYEIRNIEGGFFQEEGRIYWISIWAELEGGEWGWKSSRNHWEDDACWNAHPFGVPAYVEPWVETYEPPEFHQSLDLAFVICGAGCTTSYIDVGTTPANNWMVTPPGSSTSYLAQAITPNVGWTATAVAPARWIAAPGTMANQTGDHYFELAFYFDPVKCCPDCTMNLEFAADNRIRYFALIDPNGQSQDLASSCGCFTMGDSYKRLKSCTVPICRYATVPGTYTLKVDVDNDSLVSGLLIMGEILCP